MRQSQLRFDLKGWWRVPSMARKLSATVPPFVAPSRQRDGARGERESVRDSIANNRAALRSPSSVPRLDRARCGTGHASKLAVRRMIMMSDDS